MSREHGVWIGVSGPRPLLSLQTCWVKNVHKCALVGLVCSWKAIVSMFLGDPIHLEL